MKQSKPSSTPPTDQQPAVKFTKLSFQMPKIVDVFSPPAGGVNALCTCGSGKKYKKCHGSASKKDMRAKDRSQRVEMTFDEPISTSFSLSLNPRTKRVSVVPDESIPQPTDVIIEHNYARDKGKKIITRASVNAQESYIDFARVLSAYDLCYAVDTNTQNIRGTAVSVTGIVYCVPDRATGERAHRLRYGPMYCLEYRGVTCSPEKLGWSEVIRRHMQSPLHSNDKKYCLIVDAHLNEIERINKRVDPILDTFFLPPNFTIAYATADVRDNAHNQLIRLANRISSDALGVIKANPSDECLKNVQMQHYNGFRWWKFRA